METAIDIIQKHRIEDSNHEVCRITGTLKGFWGRLTDMETEVQELRGAVEAGFEEMRAAFKTVLVRMRAYDARVIAQRPRALFFAPKDTV